MFRKSKKNILIYKDSTAQINKVIFSISQINNKNYMSQNIQYHQDLKYAEGTSLIYTTCVNKVIQRWRYITK